MLRFLFTVAAETTSETEVAVETTHASRVERTVAEGPRSSAGQGELSQERTVGSTIVHLPRFGERQPHSEGQEVAETTRY